MRGEGDHDVPLGPGPSCQARPAPLETQRCCPLSPHAGRGKGEGLEPSHKQKARREPGLSSFQPWEPAQEGIAVAAITFESLSAICAMSFSVMMKGGVTTRQSPEVRIMMPSSWKALSMAT